MGVYCNTRFETLETDTNRTGLAFCERQAISAAGHTCGMSGGHGDLMQQHMFSAYVHVGAHENFAGKPVGLLCQLNVS